MPLCWKSHIVAHIYVYIHLLATSAGKVLMTFIDNFFLSFQLCKTMKLVLKEKVTSILAPAVERHSIQDIILIYICVYIHTWEKPFACNKYRKGFNDFYWLFFLSFQVYKIMKQVLKAKVASILAPAVERYSIEDIILKFTRAFIQERNHMLATSAVKVSPQSKIWESTKWFILKTRFTFDSQMGICAVWSAPLLFANWKVSYLDLLQAKFQLSS